MRIEIDTRTRTIWVWTRCRTYNDAKFESLHPRDKDGKFATGRQYGAGNNPVPAKESKQTIASHVDFHEIPQGIVSDLSNAIDENIKRYPFMADHFSFIGSTEAQLAKDLGDNIDLDDSVEAFYRPEPHGKRGRICFSLPALRVSAILPKDNKYHPVGTNSPKGVADHEFGHALWYQLGLDKDATASKLKEYIADYMKSHSAEEIKQNLSYYANTGPGEFFAEAFSELQNNPHPRPLAKKIGELLDAEIKSQKLDTNK